MLERPGERVERGADVLDHRGRADVLAVREEVLERQRGRVARAGDELRAEDGALGRLEQPDSEREQVSGEVAGVDRRDVGRDEAAAGW